MKHILAGALLLFLPLAAQAQNYQIHNLRFLPPDYYVGDTVQMTFVIKTDQSFDLKAPETLPDPEWVDFLSLELEAGPRESTVTLRLIPYYPGTRALPVLDFGAVQVDDLKLFTSSLLDSTSSRALSGIKPPLLIPGTKTVGILLLFLLFALPVLLIFLFRLVRSRAGDVIRSYRLNLPYRQFHRLLRHIRKTMVHLPEKEYYSELTGGLKKYLSSRLHQELKSATTSGIEACLEETRIHPALSQSLVNLFHRVDRVKFAGDKLLYSDREQLLDEVEEVSEALEDWRKKHADI